MGLAIIEHNPVSLVTPIGNLVHTPHNHRYSLPTGAGNFFPRRDMVAEESIRDDTSWIVFDIAER